MNRDQLIDRLAELLPRVGSPVLEATCELFELYALPELPPYLESEVSHRNQDERDRFRGNTNGLRVVMPEPEPAGTAVPSC